MLNIREAIKIAFLIFWRILNKKKKWHLCTLNGSSGWGQVNWLDHLSLSQHSVFLLYNFSIFIHLPPESMLLFMREYTYFVVANCPIEKSAEFFSQIWALIPALLFLGYAILGKVLSLSFLIYKVDSDNINHSRLLWGLNRFVMHPTQFLAHSRAEISVLPNNLNLFYN